MNTKNLASLIGFALLTAASVSGADAHTSTPFTGAKANHGTVTHSVKEGRNVLTLSADFQAPETPDPHWQVVDGKGHVYLLGRLKVKGGALAGDQLNRSITVPEHVPDIAKVQIWCAWAEANLGEATFEHPVTLATR